MTGDRAQTTLDFAVGVSVFLGVIAFTFAFVPAMFAPFEANAGTEFVAADRTADRLSSDALVEVPRNPSVLNDTCTTGFFDADGSAPAGCEYDDDAANLSAAVGLDDRIGLNVTIEDADGVRTLAGTRLAAGSEPTTVDDTVVATRAVLLAGEQHRLYVRVW